MARSRGGRYLQGVTHADLRQRLKAYADGTLGDGEAEVVRIHLATGCPECLRDVFTRPIGVPRPPLVIRRSPRGLVLAGLGVAVAVGAAGGLFAGTRARSGEAVDRRLDALESEVARLRVERDRAEATVRRQLDELASRERDPNGAAPAPAPPAAPPTEARSEPALPSDPPASPPGPDSRGVAGWLAEILGSEGARVVPLGPGEGTGGGTGFAVWSPSRKMVVVSASDLPLAGSDVFYRVRVTMLDRSTAWVGDVVASPRRELVISVILPATAGRVERVDLYRDPPGTPVLTARLTP
jgi:hypothetical protein